MTITYEELSGIEQILYYGVPGGKTERDANEIVRYIRLAHEGKLELVPEKLREFAQLMKHHWPELLELKLEDQKKFVQRQVHGLLDALK